MDYKITLEDIERWGKGKFDNYAYSWFADILNGEYDVKSAREDCLSVIKPKDNDS